VGIGVRETILIVDDDTAVRRMYRAALILEGYRVEEAADGYDALVRIEQHRPDLILLDEMPGLDGLSVQREIAANAFTRHIPIVIATGSGRSLNNVGVARVLRKPVAPDDLVRTIAECLAHKAPHTLSA
jgi:two-component system phosphate regulon response regulator PhoB